MSDAPVVLGVNRTQDASMCLMHGSRVVAAIQKERLTRQKHHWGKTGDVRDFYRPIIEQFGRPIDVLVECYSSDAEFAKLPEYEAELAAFLPLAPGAQRARISHHLSHLYSVFHPSPFDEAAVMIIDGQGSHRADIEYHWTDAVIPGDWREVSSYYEADRSAVRCIGKQLWDRNEDRLVGLGMFYFLLTHAIFPGAQGNEGKVMGLAPHGDPRAFAMPPLEVDGADVTIPQAWRDLLHERGRFLYKEINGDPRRFADIANLAAAGQRAFEDAVIEVAHWVHARTGARDLCFAGGTALNVSTNDRLLRETPFERVFIPPAPSDAGTSLGCAMYGIAELLHRPVTYRWHDDYLGPEPSAEAIAAAAASAADLIVEQPADLAAAAVDVLAASNVLGVYQGRSEFGPRALGHRSILGDPRSDAVRDYINAHVKEREWFRPLAPIVLLEHADEFFDMRRPSPFMQYAAPVRPTAAPVIPAVTHIDGTARLQTVAPGDDPLVRALLEGFYERTGVPVLLNTSFNGKEEPIVETPAQAVASFRHMPLDALLMPPYLIRKQPAAKPAE